MQKQNQGHISSIAAEGGSIFGMGAMNQDHLNEERVLMLFGFLT